MSFISKMMSKFTANDNDVSDEEWDAMVDEVITDVIETSDDERLLHLFVRFTERVNLGTIPVQDKNSGLITHQVLIGTCGEYMFESNPVQLMYPLQPAPLNELLDEKTIGKVMN